MQQISVQGNGEPFGPRVEAAHSLWRRTRGLMLRRRLVPGEGIDIRPCGSIHMMFMRFAIDAVFYDRSFRVTKVARGVRPWIGLAFGGRGAWGVIEMAAGSAGEVRAGDVLVFTDAGETSPAGLVPGFGNAADNGRLG
ncbi:MAG TPA: DUF192 domain-containing protein [Tepidiformaceae bacterium]|nr:DUF192 domain-containing protein [Tepidiformaceae bacterium]